MRFAGQMLTHEIVNGLSVFEGGVHFGDGRELRAQHVGITEGRGVGIEDIGLRLQRRERRFQGGGEFEQSDYAARLLVESSMCAERSGVLWTVGFTECSRSPLLSIGGKISRRNSAFQMPRPTEP